MEIRAGKIEREIRRGIIDPILQRDYEQAIKIIPHVIDEFYDNIPDNKRISYGIVHTIKELSQYLYTSLTEQEVQVYAIYSCWVWFNQTMPTCAVLYLKPCDPCRRTGGSIKIRIIPCRC